MVFIAFVLLTVSTLAVHGDEVSTDGPIIPRGCEGNSSCDEEPTDYPQEEIDYFLENNPAFVRRMKREAGLAGWEGCEESEKLDIEKGGEDGNCETKINLVTFVQCTEPLFKKVNETRVPQVILKSQFFSQKIRQVSCSSPGKQCFGELARTPLAKCKQIEVSTNLYVYDKATRDVQHVPGIILADCACELGL